MGDILKNSVLIEYAITIFSFAICSPERLFLVSLREALKNGSKCFSIPFIVSSNSSMSPCSSLERLFVLGFVLVMVV